MEDFKNRREGWLTQERIQGFMGPLIQNGAGRWVQGKWTPTDAEIQALCRMALWAALQSQEPGEAWRPALCWCEGYGTKNHREGCSGLTLEEAQAIATKAKEVGYA